MSSQQPEPGPRPRVIRLPGFVPAQETGLGNVIKRATSALGIRPCRPCAERAARLNRQITFSSWHRT